MTTRNSKSHYDEAKLYGYDEATDTWNAQKVNTDGNASVVISPFLDTDTSYIYNLDGTVQQEIISSATQTITRVYTYLNGYLQSESVVIT